MMNRCIYLFCWLCLACWSKPVSAEGQALLVIPEPGEKTLIHSDWYARKANEVKMDGNRLSAVPLDKTGWLPARVPGTVLTTLLENGLYPAPEFGLNNNLIPDIHEVGNDFYTYWFTRQFTIDALPEGRNVWLNFRGINYKAEIFLNGKRFIHLHLSEIQMADKGVMGRSPGIIRCNIRRVGTGYNLYETGIRVFGMRYLLRQPGRYASLLLMS